MVESLVHTAVAAAVLGDQTQLSQADDRPLGAQQRVGELEQRVAVAGQAAMELRAERGESGHRLDTGASIRHTRLHGPGFDHECCQHT
ncbi:hypothetical protein [Frankia sp. Cj3]|uniref:hypothetical protein n=1 Tax=Frankia sp. Cj3 TaxID=2880976 RepID=UPI001EF688E8